MARKKLPPDRLRLTPKVRAALKSISKPRALNPALYKASGSALDKKVDEKVAEKVDEKVAEKVAEITEAVKKSQRKRAMARRKAASNGGTTVAEGTTTTTTTTTTEESGTKKRTNRRSYQIPKIQIKKGALADLALAIPLGTVGAFGASAIDGYVEVSGKGWKPPVIGWRGVAGLALMVGGAIARSPVFVGAGGVLFGSSIPGVVNAIGAATNSPALMAAGDPMGLPYIRPKTIEGDYDYYDDDDFDEDELAEAAGEAIAARLEELGDGIE